MNGFRLPLWQSFAHRLTKHPIPMRRSISEILSDVQVAQIEARRKEINFTRAKLLERFDDALRASGCTYDGLPAAKIRLDRVLNPRMRKPISETTKLALAHSLDWTIQQFDKTLGLGGAEEQAAETRKQSETGPNNNRSAQQIALAALVQLETYQIARGVDLSKDNLSRVYEAAYRMFQRIRELMAELSADELACGACAKSVYDTLATILNKSLRSHLTKWPEQYEQWRKGFIGTTKSKKLSPQRVQRLFPQRKALERELKRVAQALQTDAESLRKLIFTAKT